MADDDDIQDLAPDPTGDDVGTTDEGFSDLNDFQPDSGEQEERRSHRNDPMRRIGKLTKKVARLDSDLAKERQAREEAERRLRELEDKRAENSATELESKLQELRAKRDEAFEQGDLKAYHDLEDEYDEAKAELREIKRNPPARQAPERQTPATQQPEYSQAAMAWADRNKGWYDGRPDNPRVQKAQEIANRLIEEGFDRSSDEFYDELDDRLGTPSGRPTSAGPRNGGEPPPQRQGTFGKDDIRLMRKWGMDPDDPKQRKAWMQRNAKLG